MNLLPVELSAEGDVLTLSGEGFRVSVPGARQLASYGALPRRVSLGVRPERVRVAGERGPEMPFAGEVQWVEHLGAKSILDARLGGTAIKVVVPADHAVRAAGRAWFGFEPDPNHLMDPQSGRFFR
jgi:multiple sugar transport system ATP-binding protein